MPNFALNISMDLSLILTGLFCLFVLIQLAYYLGIFTRIFKNTPDLAPSNHPVSVVICARNERKSLEENLIHVINQNYATFEVIVVNDGSTDGSIDFLDNLEKEHPRLRVIHLDIDERYHRGKKFAQTIGIKAAKHEYMVFTDADCQPASDQWLTEISKHFTDGKSIVLGVGNYARKATPVNWIIQLETFHSLLLYINFALARMPYMGVGRNLAYTRSLFFGVKGFASHQHLLSGDDDLFVNETATKTNTAVCLSKESFTVSQPKLSFVAWMKQKKRHYSTGKLYKQKHRFILGLYSISLFLMYVFGVLALLDANTTYLYVILGAFGFRFLVQAIVLYKNMKVFDYLKYYWVFPFFDIGILLTHIFIGIRGYYSKPQRWNG